MCVATVYVFYVHIDTHAHTYHTYKQDSVLSDSSNGVHTTYTYTHALIIIVDRRIRRGYFIIYLHSIRINKRFFYNRVMQNLQLALRFIGVTCIVNALLLVIIITPSGKIIERG